MKITGINRSLLLIVVSILIYILISLYLLFVESSVDDAVLIIVFTPIFALFAGSVSNRIGNLFDNLEKRIIQYPNLTFIGHGPHFWNSISSDFSSIKIHQKGKFKSFGIIDALLENYDNFYCDISGKSGFNALNRDIDQTKIFLQKHFKKKN